MIPLEKGTKFVGFFCQRDLWLLISKIGLTNLPIVGWIFCFLCFLIVRSFSLSDGFVEGKGKHE